MTTRRQGNDKGKPHNCALMIFSNYMIWVKILKFDRLPFHQEYLPSLGSKQSQRAITLLLTRRGPSYCFPLPTPTVDTQTFWICGKGSCEKFHLLIRFHVEEGETSKTGIYLHLEMLLLVFILFSRDQYHTWKHRRISIALIFKSELLFKGSHKKTNILRSHWLKGAGVLSKPVAKNKKKVGTNHSANFSNSSVIPGPGSSQRDDCFLSLTLGTTVQPPQCIFIPITIMVNRITSRSHHFNSRFLFFLTWRVPSAYSLQWL